MLVIKNDSKLQLCLTWAVSCDFRKIRKELRQGIIIPTVVRLFQSRQTQLCCGLPSSCSSLLDCWDHQPDPFVLCSLIKCLRGTQALIPFCSNRQGRRKPRSLASFSKSFFFFSNLPTISTTTRVYVSRLVFSWFTTWFWVVSLLTY